MLSPNRCPADVEIFAPLLPTYTEMLTPDALAFLAALHRRFEPARSELLERRVKRQREFDAGKKPDFLAETSAIRRGDWRIAPLPDALADRRVEITGPAGDRKLVINALNSGAQVFMADFEDALAPTWDNLMAGQVNLHHAVTRRIQFTSVEGKHYRLNQAPAILFVRPRGWHLHDLHIRVDSQPISGSLMDFGLFFFHNARHLTAHGSGPYFYLPKLESHREARLWNDVFNFAQDSLKIARGTIKATVLIETLPAAFEMDEILFELRLHSAGLNCGRWDYLFSAIKKLHGQADFMLADRARLTMRAPFMRAYTRLAIQTCHRRSAHAMGGMAAQLPIKDDAAANDAALAAVRVDKEREVIDGHDGTWVAHPGLVSLAREVFDRHMPQPNQIHRPHKALRVTAADLLDFAPQAPITEAGLRANITVAIEYMGAWLAGQGAVPIHHLMEDAATAEIARSQVWHWAHSARGVLEDGRKVTPAWVQSLIPQAIAQLRAELGEAGFAAGHFATAAELFEAMTVSAELTPFLTGYCYPRLIERDAARRVC